MFYGIELIRESVDVVEKKGHVNMGWVGGIRKNPLGTIWITRLGYECIFSRICIYMCVYVYVYVCADTDACVSLHMCT